MKIIYDTEIPKSRQKKYPPSGVCFELPWEKIVVAVQEYREKHCYFKPNDFEGDIGSVYVTDRGIQFTYKESPL